MRTGAAYSARPREPEIGVPVSTLVSSNVPDGLTRASPWRMRFSSSGTNLVKEKERDSVELTLMGSKREKVMEMVIKRREDGFWDWKLGIAMVLFIRIEM